MNSNSYLLKSKSYLDFCELHLNQMRKSQAKFIKILSQEFDFYLGVKIFGNLVFKTNFLSLSVEALISGEYKDMGTYLEKQFWQVVRDESGAVIDLHPDGDAWSPEIFAVVATGIVSGEMILVDDLDRYWKVTFENGKAEFYKQVENIPSQNKT